MYFIGQNLKTQSLHRINAHCLYSDGMQLHLQEQMNPASSYKQPLKLLMLKLPGYAIFSI